MRNHILIILQLILLLPDNYPQITTIGRNGIEVISFNIYLEFAYINFNLTRKSER